MRKRGKQISAPVPSFVPLQLLTIPEVAKRLSIGRSKVYELIKHNGLPIVLVGHSMRVSEPSLQKWIQDHEHAS